MNGITVGKLKEIIKNLPDDMPIMGLSDPEGNDINTIHYIEETIWCDEREMEIPLQQIQRGIDNGEIDYYKEWDIETLEEWKTLLEDKSNRVLIVCP